MEKCLRVLKESNKSRFDRYSRQEQSIDHIPYYLSGLSRAHFSDNLSRNSCRLFICLRFKYRRLSNINSLGLVRASCALCLTVRTEKKDCSKSKPHTSCVVVRYMYTRAFPPLHGEQARDMITLWLGKPLRSFIFLTIIPFLRHEQREIKLYIHWLVLSFCYKTWKKKTLSFFDNCSCELFFPVFSKVIRFKFHRPLSFWCGH